MAYNRVVKGSQNLYETREGLRNAIDWMMSHIDDLDRDTTYTEEVQEDGMITGWWSIDDIFDCNPHGWVLEDGTVILREGDGYD